MSALLESTSEGGEAQNVDYLELLRVSLKQKKLMYITDVVLDTEELNLEQLMKCTRHELSDLLADIHNDKDNDYKIKASHRIKFTEAVTSISAQQQEALQKQAAAAPASTSSQIKLLFLGKEEEAAVESIQSGQQFMEKNLVNMKELFNNLLENKKNVDANLDKICLSLKQEIDEKQKEISSLVDNIYQYHLNKLNKRNEVTQQSAKVVAKFYNDYENYFADNKLTKSDRKDKLLAAETSISAEVDKIEKHEDVAYNMDITVNKESVDKFFAQFVFIGLDLPAVKVELDGTVINWNAPNVSEQAVLFTKQEDDNKEEAELLINYKILYRNIQDNNENDEKKEYDEKQQDHQWNQISVSGKENKYNMISYMPCEARVQYTINNVLFFESPMSQQLILTVEYIARWSSQYKGKEINLSDDNTKASVAKSTYRTVRAEYPIKKGMIVKLNYTFNPQSEDLRNELIGVISSEFDNYKDAKVPYYNQTAEIVKYSYGADSGTNGNQHWYGKFTDLGWNLGGTFGKQNRESTIQMIVDYKTYDTCCLSYYIDGAFKGPQKAKYSMKLPELTNGHVWYPVACFWHSNISCKISYVKD